MKFVFGGQALDVARRKLRRGAELIPVEPQVFDLLVYLIESRDRVVSKADLIDSVWGGRIRPALNLDEIRRFFGHAAAADLATAWK